MTPIIHTANLWRQILPIGAIEMTIICIFFCTKGLCACLNKGKRWLFHNIWCPSVSHYRHFKRGLYSRSHITYTRLPLVAHTQPTKELICKDQNNAECVFNARNMYMYVRSIYLIGHMACTLVCDDYLGWVDFWYRWSWAYFLINVANSEYQ